ncbi:MAG: CNNM domain-containing protein [Saprospiraceae bacterium]
MLGKKLSEFKEDIDRPLSAILTLNTIAHTVGAIGVGAMAASIFADKQPFLGIISYESIVAVVMTLAILFLSEIIPKTIGANNWKSLTPFTVSSLSLLLKVLAPIIWISQLITKKFKNEKNKSVFTRTDFLALTDMGTSTGAIHKNESKIISNLLGMDKLKVQDVMTPRVVIQVTDQNQTLQSYYEENQPLRFSRIPIYEGQPDHIVGMVLKDEILQNIIEGKGNKALSSISRNIKMINQEKSLNDLFSNLTEEKDQIAVVVDNYGSVTGIVTMEDALETIIGMEIIDETDSVADLQALARKKWEERAKKLGVIE